MHHIEQTVTARKLTRKGKLILPQTSAILLTPHANSPLVVASNRCDSPSHSFSDCSDEPPMLTPLDSCANTTVCPCCAASEEATQCPECCHCCSPSSSFEHARDVDVESFQCELGMLCSDYDLDAMYADESLMTSAFAGVHDCEYTLVYQHNPYAVQVLPAQLYPSKCTVGHRQKQPRQSVESGRGKKSTTANQEKRSTRHLHHRNPIFQTPSGAPAFAAPQHEYMTPECLTMPSAVSAVAVESKQALIPQKVMCCYFKQKGFCKMGDKCWHGHEGDLYTPCHYGADCKAGHATLMQMQMNMARL